MRDPSVVAILVHINHNSDIYHELEEFIKRKRHIYKCKVAVAANSLSIKIQHVFRRYPSNTNILTSRPS